MADWTKATPDKNWLAVDGCTSGVSLQPNARLPLPRFGQPGKPKGDRDWTPALGATELRDRRRPEPTWV